MHYDLFEHRHRFAVWAAARATQRAFVSVEVLRSALEATDIVDFVRRPSSLATDATAFDVCHRRWCSAIVGQLHRFGIRNATYGRAAKLVAVYLKAMVVIGPNSDSILSSVIHPPIDRILLQNLASAGVVAAQSNMLRSVRWTKLNAEQYYRLIAELKAVLPAGEPFWKLEQYWTVTSNNSEE